MGGSSVMHFRRLFVPREPRASAANTAGLTTRATKINLGVGDPFAIARRHPRFRISPQPVLHAGLLGSEQDSPRLAAKQESARYFPRGTVFGLSLWTTTWWLSLVFTIIRRYSHVP
jgi:hypothetical protein